jgi:tetratricopeptide (TPR) repeat protein
MNLLVSMQERNITLEPRHFSFPRREAMRFEWLALLAYTRVMESARGGWVSIEEIRQLPLWRGRSVAHVGTNVGRYIQQLEKSGVKMVEAETPWRGPYRLRIDPEAIRFDVSIGEVRAQLGKLTPALPSRKQLLMFTEKYARATSLLMEGRLSLDLRVRKKHQENALAGFSSLAREGGLDARLRLLASLGAIRVLDRLGRYGAVADRLDDCEKLVRRTTDPVVTARFFLTNARRYLRVRDNEAVEHHLSRAKELAAKSPDSAVLGASADQEGVYLSAKDKHEEALPLLVEGLSARLPTENFDAVQASCFNIGNTLQRIGERCYAEAEQWLELCVNITEWMRLGRYEALSEIILAKMAVETGRTDRYAKWIEEGEKITERTRNTTDMIWCNVIKGMHYQRKRDVKATVEHLVKARKIYLRRQDYDSGVPDRFLARKFPEVWDEVIKQSAQQGALSR